MGTLVVGYDGSECADAALDDAIELAEATGDRIVVAFGYEPGGPGEEHRAHREQVRKFGERVTAPAIARAGEAGVEVDGRAARRAPGRRAAVARRRARRARDRRRHLRRAPVQGRDARLDAAQAPLPLRAPGARGPGRSSRLNARPPLATLARDERIYDRLAELPLKIECYELDGPRPRVRRLHPRRRRSSTCTATARRGSARTSSTRSSITSPIATRGRSTTSPAATTLGEVCELVGDARPVRRRAARVRGVAPLPPLGLRVGGARPGAAPERARPLGGRRARPAAASLRLLDPARPASATRTPVLDRGDHQPARQVPDARVQARPRERLGRRADRGDRRARPGAGARPEGDVRRHPRRRRHRPGALPRGRRALPGGLPRGPRPQRRDPRGAGSLRRPDHLGRAAALARRRQGAGPQGDQLEALAVRLARGAARHLRVLRRERDRRSTAAARARSSAAAARSSTSRRSSTPRPPNDIAPSGYNDPAVPAGMPTSPMDPAPSRDRLPLGRGVGSRHGSEEEALLRRRAQRPDRERVRGLDAVHRDRRPLRRARPCRGSPASSTVRRSRSATTR